MAGAKKQKFSLDGLDAIMSGVASIEKLPDIRPIELNMLFVGPQPRQLLGMIENLGQDPANEDWLIPLSELLERIRIAATENRKSVAGISLGELEQMAQSIRQHGVLQPILVRYLENEDRYIVTDGHRRALASLLADEQKIDAKIKRNWSREDILAEQLIANLQRKDLTALELARSIAQLRTLYTEQIRESDPKLHPNQLLSKVWDKLENSLGFGRRQLQRLMQLNEMADRMDTDILNLASDLRERQLRPFFKLPKEDQPEAIMIAALNKERSYQDFEKLVDKRLNGEEFGAIALELGMNLPEELVPDLVSGINKLQTRIQSNPEEISAELDHGFDEDSEEYDAYRVKNVLVALKRLPTNPEPLLRRLEQELENSNERERKKRLLRIESVELEAKKLSRRLEEIRKKFV